MLNIQNTIILLVCVFSLIRTAFVEARDFVTFPTVQANTPYKEVTALSASDPDLKFVYGKHAEHQYNLFWRAQGTAKGVVAFVHGGCWLDMFDIRHSNPLSTALAQAGYHVWSIEYRRTGSGGEWPNALEDVKAGLSNITKLSKHGVNLSVVNLLGHSAGGHLALLSAADAERILPDSIRLNTLGLAAIVDIAAYSKGRNSCQTATSAFMNGSLNDKPLAYYFANPKNFRFQYHSGNKVTLLHGGMDSIVPLQQAQHQDIKQRVLDEAGHFDWIHPGSQAFKLILDNLEDY